MRVRSTACRWNYRSSKLWAQHGIGWGAPKARLRQVTRQRHATGKTQWRSGDKGPTHSNTSGDRWRRGYLQRIAEALEEGMRWTGCSVLLDPQTGGWLQATTGAALNFLLLEAPSSGVSSYASAAGQYAHSKFAAGSSNAWRCQRRTRRL